MSTMERIKLFVLIIITRVAVEDIEAATSSVVKLPEEPTFPIYLKVNHFPI